MAGHPLVGYALSRTARLVDLQWFYRPTVELAWLRLHRKVESGMARDEMVVESCEKCLIPTSYEL